MLEMPSIPAFIPVIAVVIVFIVISCVLAVTLSLPLSFACEPLGLHYYSTKGRHYL